ncbi:hypothetical protein ACTMTJ_39280 [Phytohabitans sp. LJ34]
MTSNDHRCQEKQQVNGLPSNATRDTTDESACTPDTALATPIALDDPASLAH